MEVNSITVGDLCSLANEVEAADWKRIPVVFQTSDGTSVNLEATFWPAIDGEYPDHITLTEVMD